MTSKAFLYEDYETGPMAAELTVLDVPFDEPLNITAQAVSFSRSGGGAKL